MARLRNLSKIYEFGELKNDLVRDIFVVGVKDRSFQEK